MSSPDFSPPSADSVSPAESFQELFQTSQTLFARVNQLGSEKKEMEQQISHNQNPQFQELIKTNRILQEDLNCEKEHVRSGDRLLPEFQNATGNRNQWREDGKRSRVRSTFYEPDCHQGCVRHMCF
jgi:hypothetical protein